MAAVLLWLAWLDELRKNPQANPPGGKGGKTGEGMGGEGDAIVGADPVGKTVFLEQSGEDGFCAGNSGGMKSLAADDVTAEVIGDREGKTIDTVAGFELALEIRTPKIVGGENDRGRFARVANFPTSSGQPDQAIALIDITDGGTAREIPIGMLIVDDPKYFLATPGGVLTAYLEEHSDNFGMGLIWRDKGSSRKILKGFGSFIRIAFYPFVTGLARNIISFTELGRRKPILQKIGDELDFLVHR
jgi:hypothetical protein